MRDPETAISTDKEAAEAKLRERVRNDAERADIKAVITSPEGMRFLERLLAQTYFYQTAYQQGTDIFDAGYRDGMRRMALWMLSEVARVDRNAAGRMQANLLPKPSEDDE